MESETIRVTELSNEYAIVRLPQTAMDELAWHTEVEYVEKPKRLIFAVNNAKSASCINPVQREGFDLEGEGILVAVLDSGVDYRHPDFIHPDGTTRIVAIWDQTAENGEAPEG